MGIKQYKVGKSWEEEVMDYYIDKGFFVYKVPTMNSGTVFDIFVARRGACLMIECKHITGSKLYYKGCGLAKKEDEIEHFVKTTGNNVYIYVKSDTDGCFWTTWEHRKKMLQTRGYITTKDMFKSDLRRYIKNESNTK